MTTLTTDSPEAQKDTQQLREWRDDVAGIANTLIPAGTEDMEAEASAWENLANHLLENADTPLLIKALEYQKAQLLGGEYDFVINDQGTEGQDTAAEVIEDINRLLADLKDIAYS